MAGLACAHALQGTGDVTLFERAPRLGGHMHAVPTTDATGAAVDVEVGFLAFHRSRYPRLAALLDAHGIETAPSPTGLVVHDGIKDLVTPQAAWLERADLRAPLAALWARLLRHERHPDQHPYPNLPLAEVMAAEPALLHDVLVPSIAALWGFPTHEILAMSAAAVFESLGRFGREDEPFERIVPSTAAWLARLAAALPLRLVTGAHVTAVTPDGHVVVDGESHAFDAVVIATHADTARALWQGPPSTALAAITYLPSVAILHDTPGYARGAPYTVHREPDGRLLVSWDMGLLQGAHGLVVTVGPPDFDLPNARARVVHGHPAMRPAALAAIPALEAHDEGPVYLAGSYFGRTGANEAAVASGQRAAERVRRYLQDGSGNANAR